MCVCVCGGGGGGVVTEYWGGEAKYNFFLLTLYNFRNIWGRGRARAPSMHMLSGDPGSIPD